VCNGVLANAPYRLFFSGSPTRADGAEKLLQSIIGETVLTLTTREAVEKGFVSPHDFRIVRIESSDPNLGSTDPLEIKRMHFLRNKNICAFIAKLCNSLAARGEQVLVLCEETNQISMLLPKLTVPTVVAHSEKSAARLLELGIPKVDPDESVETFNKKGAMILLGSGCISTGTNIYPQTHTVNWQGGASEVRCKQGAVGRSVRLPQANPWAKLCGEKKSCTIWDFDVIGNFVLERHLEERMECYKDSGEGLIKYIRLK
jgi:superfamily II DNA or RNA helicase